MSVKKAKPVFLMVFVLAALVFGGCVSFRSEMNGAFTGQHEKAAQLAPVTVCFYFSHLEQSKGFDIVPKIVPPQRGFRDIFGESMKELSNIESFATFTDNDNDIDNVRRRHTRDSLRQVNDFTIHITFKKENSFAKHFLADLVTYGTATIVPTGFSWDYIVEAEVKTSSGKILKTYTRRSTLSTWYNFTCLFVYPFMPSAMKIEEIYLESLRDIFIQIEAEKILKI